MPFEPRATSFSMANAQILAQAAAMAYREPAQCAKWATVSGFTGPFDFFDNADTQGFVAESGDAIIVAFRGTQPNRPMDWFVDARATRGKWDHNVGQVHDGFYSALRKVWGVTLPKGEVLPKRLVNRGNKTIWITGHSLGGALAELCAAQAMFVSHIPVQGVYTFGQPRVGNKDFAAAVNEKLGSGIFRFVNDRDIVPRVPLFTMGFCHYGNQTFLRFRRQRHRRTVSRRDAERCTRAREGRVQPRRHWTGGWPDRRRSQGARERRPHGGAARRPSASVRPAS